MGKQVFNIKGMTRDLDPAKSSSQYAYEIRNLRITAQEDTTMLALVSEKGNTQYSIINEDNNTTTIVGNIIGYYVLHNYLVLFTHSTNDLLVPDRIYRLEMGTTYMTTYGDTIGSHDYLYGGNLGFGDAGVNIEAIGVFENENLQRVYWIDTVHQPRVINIAADKDTIHKWNTMSICPFDFMLEMRLEESVYVTYRYDIFGAFPSGTIQYILAYYTNNGQRTPAFHTSSLYYTSVNNKGGSPEETCSGAFEIKIPYNSIDSNFDYISIYSVQRTSMNGTPICKKVRDLRIADFTGSTFITYIDNGLSSETVDYAEIMYLGGSNIVPYAMEQKDNTLFFGNIKYNDFVIREYDMDTIKDNATVDFCPKSSVALADTDVTFYPYVEQINKPASVITTFKFGESYYFGLILQNKYGQWSNVVPLQDASSRITNTLPPQYSTNNKNIFQPIAVSVTLNATAISLLQNLECKRVKIVRMDEIPSIICQGVLNPTVFNKSRKDGYNYAQSSWYFRPIGSDIEDNKAQYYHNLNIRFVKEVNCNEIQGASSHSLNYYCIPDAFTLTDMDMFVDWNILTIHSPDIEFGDMALYDNKDCNLRIVGVVPIEYGTTSMYLDLDTPPHSPLGRYDHFTITNTNYNNNKAPVCLSNLYFIDNEYDSYSNDWTNSMRNYVVFPWHRFSSLGAQMTPTTDDEWYGKPRRKCMATLRSSFRPLYEESAVIGNTNLLDITNFRYCDSINSNILIPNDNNCDDKGRIYHSNIDMVLSGEIGNYGTPTNSGSVDLITKEDSFIRMNYKSGTHGVLALKYTNGGEQTVLPNTCQGSNGRRDNIPPAHYMAKLIIGEIDGTNQNIVPMGNGFIIVNKAYANQTISSGETGDLVMFRHPLHPEGGMCDGYNYDDFWHVVSDEAAIHISGYDASTYPVEDWYYLAIHDVNLLIANSNGPGVPDEEVSGKYWFYIYLYIDTSNPILAEVYAPIEGVIIELYKIGVTNDASDKTLTFVSNSYPDSNVSEIDDIVIPNLESHDIDYLYLADLSINRLPVDTFAGTRWLVAGLSKNIPTDDKTLLIGDIGDTYFQRYDCLKTYPWSSESQNQIVEILSFICETRINIEGRYDNRRGMSDNTLNDATNFNKINMAYSSPDNFYTPQFIDLDITSVYRYPNQLIWTLTKSYGSKIDTWSHIVPTSTLSLDGNLGEIKSLKLWNDNLICLQDSGISKIMYNERTTITTKEGVPIQIANSGKVEGSQYISNHVGCSNKNSVRTTQEGIYFIDSNTRELYRLSKSLEALSKSKGFNTYFYKADINLDTIKTFYDPKLKDVYFRVVKNTYSSTITEYLLFNEQIDEFTSFFDYDMDFVFPYKDALVSVQHNSGNLWKQFSSNEFLRYFNESSGGNPVYKQYLIELIAAENPTDTKIFTNVEFRADVLNSSITDPLSQSTEVGLPLLASINKLPFADIRVWNEYQDTGYVSFDRLYRKGTNLSQKFRIWRADIPRSNDIIYKFNRIASPWARIKLRGNKDNIKAVIHDIGVIYF